MKIVRETVMAEPSSQLARETALAQRQQETGADDLLAGGVNETIQDNSDVPDQVKPVTFFSRPKPNKKIQARR